MAGPHEDFVERLHRQIERFAREREIERAYVEVELRDGLRFALERVSPEPGYGFITLTPQAEQEDVPEQLVVPIGGIARIEFTRAEEERSRLGFSLPA
jgi:hypothetical protein